MLGTPPQFDDLRRRLCGACRNHVFYITHRRSTFDWLALGDLRGRDTGQLVDIEVGERSRPIPAVAFVPDPLPESPQLSAPAWTAVAEAAEQLGRLDATTVALGVDPVLLSQPTIRREAVSTSALEGTFAPAMEVLSSEVDVNRPRSPAIVEILNYVATTTYAVQRMQSLPIGTRLSCELQSMLVEGTPGADWQQGKIRETQVIIGAYKGCSVREARYVPPPPGQLLSSGMDEWEKWINREHRIHSVVVAAMSHYQFEALHPFTDGNGRIGRLLAILQLIDSGLLAQPLINLSSYFEVRADEYKHRLREVSTDGAWDPWVTMFAEALAWQAHEARVRARSLLKWRDTNVQSLRNEGMRRGVALDLVASLIESPMTNVRQVAERFDVSVASANGAVNRLAELGVLTEITGGNYNRVFQAAEVVEIIFGDAS